MENKSIDAINKEIAELERQKKELLENITEEKEELTKEEVFLNYEIPTLSKAEKVNEKISSLRNVSLINIAIGLVVSLVLWLALSSKESISFLIGVLTCSFVYSILIRDVKNLAFIHISRYKRAMIISNIKRLFIYAAILFFVYVFEEQKDLSLIFTFIGMLTIKLTNVVYFLVRKGRA